MKPEDMLGGAPVGKPYIRTRDVFQTDNDRDTEGYSDEALALVADVAKTGVPEETNSIGMAGCGKTTLTRLMNGLAPRFYRGRLEGSVTVEDKEVPDTPSWKMSARGQRVPRP